MKQLKLFLFLTILSFILIGGVNAVPTNFNSKNIVLSISSDKTNWSGSFHTISDDIDFPVNKVLGNVTKVIFSGGSSTNSNITFFVDNNKDWSNFTSFQFWAKSNLSISSNKWAILIKNNDVISSNFYYFNLTTSWNRYIINFSNENRNNVSQVYIFSVNDGVFTPYIYRFKDLELIDLNNPSLNYIQELSSHVEYAISAFNFSNRTSLYFRSLDMNSSLKNKSDLLYNRGLAWLPYLFVNDPFNIYRGDIRVLQAGLMGKDYYTEKTGYDGNSYVYSDKTLSSYPTGMFSSIDSLRMISYYNSFLNNKNYILNLGNYSKYGCVESSSTGSVLTNCGIAFYSDDFNGTNYSDGSIFYANLTNSSAHSINFYVDLTTSLNNSLLRDYYFEDLNNDTYIDNQLELEIKYKDTFINTFYVSCRDRTEGATFYQVSNASYLTGTNSNTWKVYRTTINVSHLSYYNVSKFISCSLAFNNWTLKPVVPISYINLTSSRKQLYLNSIKKQIDINTIRFNNSILYNYSSTCNQDLGGILSYFMYSNITNNSNYFNLGNTFINGYLNFCPKNSHFFEQDYNPKVYLGSGIFTGYDGVYHQLSSMYLAEIYLFNQSSTISSVLNGITTVTPYLIRNQYYNYTLNSVSDSRVGGNGRMVDSFLPSFVYLLHGLGFPNVERLINISINSLPMLGYYNNTAIYDGMDTVMEYYHFYQSPNSANILDTEYSNRYIKDYSIDSSRIYVQTNNYFTSVFGKGGLPASTFSGLCLINQTKCYILSQAGYHAINKTGGFFWDSNAIVYETYTDASENYFSHAEMYSYNGSGVNYSMMKQWTDLPLNSTINNSCFIQISLHNPQASNNSYNNTIEFKLNNVFLGNIYQASINNSLYGSSEYAQWINVYNWYNVSTNCTLIKSLMVPNNDTFRNNLTWRFAGNGTSMLSTFDVLFGTGGSSLEGSYQKSAGSTDNGTTWNFDSISPYMDWGSSPGVPKDGEFQVKFFTGNYVLLPVSSSRDVKNGSVSVINSNYPYKVNISSYFASEHNDISINNYVNSNITFYDKIIKVNSNTNNNGNFHITLVNNISSYSNVKSYVLNNILYVDGLSFILDGSFNVSITRNFSNLTINGKTYFLDDLYFTNISKIDYYMILDDNYQLTEGIIMDGEPFKINSITSDKNYRYVYINSSLIDNITIPLQLASIPIYGCNVKYLYVNGVSTPFTCDSNTKLISLNVNMLVGTNIITESYYSVDTSTNGFCQSVTKGYDNFFMSIGIILGIVAVFIIVFILYAVSKVARGEDLDTNLIDNLFENMPLKVILVSILVITMLVWIIIVIMGSLCQI